MEDPGVHQGPIQDGENNHSRAVGVEGIAYCKSDKSNM